MEALLTIVVPILVVLISTSATLYMWVTKKKQVTASAASTVTNSAVNLMTKLERQIERLEISLEDTEQRVVALTNNVDTLTKDVRLLQAARDHWRAVATEARDEYISEKGTSPKWWRTLIPEI